MMRWVRELRLIPVVLLATAGLAALKLLGLVLDGGYLLTEIDVAALDRPIHVERDSDTGATTATNNKLSLPQSGLSWAQQVLGYPDITGSVAAEKQAEKNAERATGAPPAKPEKQPDGRVIDLATKPASPAERAILERLGERRQELDARARELEIRENLLKSAEKRLDGRVNELKTIEQQAGGSAARKDAEDAARLKGLVTMYENMKPKDAAKIFDRLEMPVLIAVVSQIKPRVMADILAQMQPDAAERLTTELASRATGIAPMAAPVDLPKIEGQPVRR